MTPLRVAACQINPVVGDLDANVARITAAARDAAQRGAQVAVFGEMALTGYPVEDLALRRSFVDASRAAVGRLAATVRERWGGTDVLMNNAGGTFDASQRTSDGHEPNFQINHLAPLHLRSSAGGIALERVPGNVQGATAAALDPRIHFVGYGPSASTIGASRAARQAARAVEKYLAEDRSRD